ncbi:MAG: C39 family peptidase [Candidatus Jorgensenbacteria bacterium]
MHYAVTALSQRFDVKNRFWRSRSCGIVALKMVLDFWHREGAIRRMPPTIPSLVRLAHNRGAYIRSVGWSHRGLAMVAKHFGLAGQNYDWAKLTPTRAFPKLKKELRRGPVLASIYGNLDPKRHGHLVAITGIGKGVVLYLDPDSKTRSGIARRASVKKFLIGWKRRIIVAYPKRKPGYKT